LPILENVAFSIEKGQFVGIFGPNGGGKTTLLKLLLGLLPLQNGKIEIPATDRIGYVPQIRRFDKSFPISVIEVILQGLLSKYRGYGGFSKELKEKAYEALKKVGLEDKAKHAFGSLSGGQIQRTLIARALVSDPEILLLDEATVGIDPDALKEIFQFLLELKGKITIVLVTHDLHFVANEMDHLFCINKSATSYSPKEVCEHFALGLYHPPHTEEDKHD